MKTPTAESIALRLEQIAAEFVAVFDLRPEQFSGMMTLILESAHRDLDDLQYHRFQTLLVEHWTLKMIQEQVEPARLRLLDWDRVLSERNICWLPGAF